MKPFLSNAALRKSTLFMLMTLVFVLMGATLVAGEGLVQPDGRLNQVTHFGGDAFYCVDENFVPTHQYSDFGEGGFRLLDMFGQELWFVPALQVSAAVAEAKETGKSVLVGEGRGTYGPVTIYTYVTNENDDYFTFSGYDEYGKPNSITFKFCIPVGPIPNPDSDEPVDEELCTLVLPQKPALGKVITPLMGVTGPSIPCDECLNNPANQIDAKRYLRPSLQGGGFCLEFPLG